MAYIPCFLYHPKMENLLLFTQKQPTSFAYLFSTAWTKDTEAFLKVSFLVFHRIKKIIPIYNSMTELSHQAGMLGASCHVDQLIK